MYLLPGPGGRGGAVAVDPVDPRADDGPGDGHDGHVGHATRVHPDGTAVLAHPLDVDMYCMYNITYHCCCIICMYKPN
jgi:hypothetical protein